MTFTKEHQDWLENDELFFGQLRVGREGEIKVAHQLLFAGIPVQLPPLQIRESVEQRGEFSDQADLYAGPWNKPKRIEVKHVDVRFDSLKTFPFNDVVVVSTNKWRNVCDAGNKPIAFVIVSQYSESMFAVPLSTEEKWRIKLIRDNLRGMSIEVLVVDKKECKEISELIKYLRNL